jgi:hypothetical protein
MCESWKIFRQGGEFHHGAMSSSVTLLTAAKRTNIILEERGADFHLRRARADDDGWASSGAVNDIGKIFIKRKIPSRAAWSEAERGVIIHSARRELYIGFIHSPQGIASFKRNCR